MSIINEQRFLDSCERHLELIVTVILSVSERALPSKAHAIFARCLLWMAFPIGWTVGTIYNGARMLKTLFGLSE